VRPLVLLILLAILIAARPIQAQSACGSAPECRDLAVAAQQRGDVETFHDLAWRAVQTGPRNDAALLLLLARAQSLSGRAGDALVMLQRLAARGIDISDANTSDDFRRVRNLPAWAEWKGIAAPASDSPTTPPATAVSPPAATATPSRAPSPSASPKSEAAAAKAPAPVGSSKAAGGAPETVKPPVDRDEALSLPSTVGSLAAMAYDGVSGRLVLADDSSGTLKVLSEVSGNAANLVSRGWGGPYKTTGIAIDPAHGDLWVVATANDDGSAPAPSVVHRLQLVSGRLLYSVPAPATSPEARFVAVALAGTAVYALDAAGRRLFELSTSGKTLRPRATIKVDDPASLAVGSDGVAFVAHGAGILRVTLANGQSTRVTAARGVDLRGLQSIARYHDTLFGIQRRDDGTLAAVRIRLAANGQRATRLDVIGEAAASAVAIMGNIFYYVGLQAAGSSVVQRVKLP